jgi:hypothetical protein
MSYFYECSLARKVEPNVVIIFFYHMSSENDIVIIKMPLKVQIMPAVLCIRTEQLVYVQNMIYQKNSLKVILCYTTTYSNLDLLHITCTVP